MIFNMVGGGGTVVPVSLNISGIKTAYKEGDKIDLTGLVATVIMSNGKQKDVASEVVATPTAGATVTSDTTRISFRWAWPNDTSVVLVSDVPITTKVTLTSLSISAPVGRSYTKGSNLDLSGFVVNAHFESGRVLDVTSQCTFTPLNGSILEDVGSLKITASYSYGDTTKTASTTVSVLPKIVTWSNGTKTEIKDMVDAADQGLIKLTDYWAVGDERSINIPNIPAYNTVSTGENYQRSQTLNAQTCKLVLISVGGKKLSASHKDCNFMVWISMETGGFSIDGCTSDGKAKSAPFGWGYCSLEYWLNVNLLSKLQELDVGDSFRDFITYSDTYPSNDANKVSEITETISIPSYMEVNGEQYKETNGSGESALDKKDSQISWFKTSANKPKCCYCRNTSQFLTEHNVYICSDKSLQNAMDFAGSGASVFAYACI